MNAVELSKADIIFLGIFAITLIYTAYQWYQQVHSGCPWWETCPSGIPTWALLGSWAGAFLINGIYFYAKDKEVKI